MKAVLVVCLAVALLLAGLGAFGVFDLLRSRPGWEAAKRDEIAFLRGRRGPLAQALREDTESKDRARTVGMVFSLAGLACGTALGVWSVRAYLLGSREAGPPPDGGQRSDPVCSICGATLRPRDCSRGFCDLCDSRTR